MESKIVKRIFKTLGYVKIAQFLENIFRTRNAIDMYIAQCHIVAETHKEMFKKYRKINTGKDIAIIATGPSLNKYKSIENTINIGVNKAFLYDKISLKYYFAHDYAAIKSYIKEIEKYPNIIKFYGILPPSHYGCKRYTTQESIIPESLIFEHCANKYYLYSKQPILPIPFTTDIDKTWMPDGGSCIFSAVQFALFTNPKRIYLVGCDCSNGYFDEQVKRVKINKTFYNSWKNLKKFAETYYPNTEIISVNPVGLKGLFTDLYQE